MASSDTEVSFGDEYEWRRNLRMNDVTGADCGGCLGVRNEHITQTRDNVHGGPTARASLVDGHVRSGPPADVPPAFEDAEVTKAMAKIMLYNDTDLAPDPEPKVDRRQKRLERS